MKNRIQITILLLTILLIASPALSGPNINPGLWEFTTETQMQGAANMQVPPETHTQCITPDDTVPMSQGASQECQITNVVTNGDTISWDIVCGGQGGQMEGSGEVTYHGNTMEGRMVMAIIGTNMQITNTITGRRVGNCSGQPSASSSSPPPPKQTQPSAVEEAVTEDAADVGQAARDEVKQNTIDEVRKGVRSIFSNIFD
jgi:hypothetical protein